MESAVDGSVGRARECLAAIDGSALAHWFHFTAQYAGADRVRATSGDTVVATSGRTEPGKKVPMPSKMLWIECLERDEWKCRYCGSPLLFSEDFSKFAGIVGAEHLPLGATNLTKHGSYFLHVATLDHVVPRSCGGTNDPANLVSACHACNFGKDDFTLDQLKLDRPDRGRFTTDKTWPGTVRRLREM